MTTITTTDLKKDLKKYLDLSREEDVYVMRNNKVIAKIVNPSVDIVNEIEALGGSLKSDMSLDDIRKARLIKQ